MILYVHFITDNRMWQNDLLGAKCKQNWNPNKTNLIEWISQIKQKALSDKL